MVVLYVFNENSKLKMELVMQVLMKRTQSAISVCHAAILPRHLEKNEYIFLNSRLKSAM